MPLYDYKCDTCEDVAEQCRPMSDRGKLMDCLGCGGKYYPIFTPNANICIPGHFKRDSNWHQRQEDRGPDSAPYSDSNSVHSPKRTSFREKLEENLGVR